MLQQHGGGTGKASHRLTACDIHLPPLQLSVPWYRTRVNPLNYICVRPGLQLHTQGVRRESCCDHRQLSKMHHESSSFTTLSLHTQSFCPSSLSESWASQQKWPCIISLSYLSVGPHDLLEKADKEKLICSAWKGENNCWSSHGSWGSNEVEMQHKTHHVSALAILALI